MSLKSLTIAAAALAVATGAHAAQNLVVNGHFDQDSLGTAHEFGASHDGQTLTGWTSASASAFNVYFPTGTALGPTDADTRFSEHGQFLSALPTNADPDGGAFVALDGDVNARGALTQVIDGLVVGHSYVLTFDWAAAQFADRTGPTTEQLQISLGSDVFNTPVLSADTNAPSLWKVGHHTFVATDTTEVLSFLSIGTPTGLPPVALLDGVSLEAAAVPEPATWGLMILGFGGVGATLRRRRRVVELSAVA